MIGPRLSTLRSNRRAAAAVEFALVCLPFTIFLLAVMGTGLHFYLQQALDYATQAAARQVQLGHVPASYTATDFINKVFCPTFGAFQVCSDLFVDVRPVTDYQQLTNPGVPDAPDSIATTGFAFCPGQPGQLMYVHIVYLAPSISGALFGTSNAIIANAVITSRRIGIAAGSVAEIATTNSAQTQALNVLTDVQAWQATTAPFAFFPNWTAKASRQTFAITLSAVVFTPTQAGCTQNCSYAANVTWSVANDLGVARLRACGQLTMAPDTDPATYDTLPANAFGPTSLLVADISYTFQPIFFGFLIGDIPMMRSAYLSPRINNVTLLQSAGGAGVSVKCPPTI